jgi:hypothetical protein
MTKAERDLLLFIADALASPWCDVLRGVSWSGERPPRAQLGDLAAAVRAEADGDARK